MIDFACKKFELREVVKCSLGLTKADLQVFEAFLKNPSKDFKSSDLAGITGLDLSTVQRSVKKLYEKRVLRRKQVNLSKGGYTYKYRAKPKEEVTSIVRGIIFNWAERVSEELDKLGEDF